MPKEQVSRGNRWAEECVPKEQVNRGIGGQSNSWIEEQVAKEQVDRRISSRGIGGIGISRMNRNRWKEE